MRSTAKRLLVVAMAMAMVVALPGVALAHHPLIDAEADCQLADGSWYLDYTAEAWEYTDFWGWATDDQRTNNDVRIEINGAEVYAGEFNVGNDFTISGSFLVPGGDSATVKAIAVPKWGPGEDLGQPGQFRETTVLKPTELCALGRMTGGGSVFLGEGRDKVRYTHGFELHCNAADLPNNLQINWPGNRFHLTELTLAICTDDDSIEPHPPWAPFDTYYGEGIGRLNGEPGYSIEFTFTDTGQPGRNDTADIAIAAPGGSVFNFLTFGNHQAHK